LSHWIWGLSKAMVPSAHHCTIHWKPVYDSVVDKSQQSWHAFTSITYLLKLGPVGRYSVVGP
jgi:hypothetical protein